MSEPLSSARCAKDLHVAVLCNLNGEVGLSEGVVGAVGESLDLVVGIECCVKGEW